MRQILILCRLSALLILTERDIGGYRYSSMVRVSGSVLDVAVAGAKVFVSVDEQSDHQSTLIDCLMPGDGGAVSASFPTC